MPGTARMRGLADSFDIEQAIPASAKYLGELKTGFGNLGLAAAAYNAGETRVSRWLSSGGFLPLETENYVLDIMGEPVDKFYRGGLCRHHPAARSENRLSRCLPAACRSSPSTTVAMSTINVKPWGIQVAGNFRRAAAIRQWQRLERPHLEGLLVGRARRQPGALAARPARHLCRAHRRRQPRGGRRDLPAACGAAGGSCVVLRNR